MFGYGGNRRIAVGPRPGAESTGVAPITKYTLSLEEVAARYGPPKHSREKLSPLAELTDPVIQQKKQEIRKKYTSGRDLSLTWDVEQVNQVIEDYQAGKPIWDMAERYQRKQLELAILIAELAEDGRIESREGGVYGVERTLSRG